MLSVSEWGGRPSTEIVPLQLPVHRVVISHTATEMCRSLDTCKDRVRAAQRYHMLNLNWSQVGYNFLIGGDGRVYIGRGWDTLGAHTKNYNSQSIGISFIGYFESEKPTDVQVRACHLLIADGVRRHKLASDYRLYGHRQLVHTDSPGTALYHMITTWPHWSSQK